MKELGYLPVGESIHYVIDKAIKVATEANELVTFSFNGVVVVVARDSNQELIFRDWRRGMNGYLGGNPIAGPYPSPVLSASELASDAAIEARNQRRREKLVVESAMEQSAKFTALRGALKMSGPLELVDQESWNKIVKSNSNDDYSARAVQYAEEWGRLMQTRIASGETVGQCADDMGRLADCDGITGAMYGWAACVLENCWKYGDELRKWRASELKVKA
jgi:hypothetical protein